MQGYGLSDERLEKLEREEIRRPGPDDEGYWVKLHRVTVWGPTSRVGYWDVPVVYSWATLPAVSLRVDIVGPDLGTLNGLPCYVYEALFPPAPCHPGTVNSVLPFARLELANA